MKSFVFVFDLHGAVKEFLLSSKTGFKNDQIKSQYLKLHFNHCRLYDYGKMCPLYLTEYVVLCKSPEPPFMSLYFTFKEPEFLVNTLQ